MAVERDRGRSEGPGLDATRAGAAPFADAEARGGVIGEVRGERRSGVVAVGGRERRSGAFGGSGPQGTPETDDTVAVAVGAGPGGGAVGRFAVSTLAEASVVAAGAAAGGGAETGETRVGSAAAFVDEGLEVVSAALLAVAETGRIGRFVILRELGRGAMGVVFAAYDEELDRKVAIKLLHASRGDDTSIGRAMLLREAQALARLAHPNVVAVHEVGTVAGAVFVAMEYVAGGDLQRWLTTARRGWREVVAVLRQAGEGLAAAHREGLVHRDFKPSNVLVGDDGRVRVADFGLAARRGATGVAGGRPASEALTATLTGEGALVGTPVYMAPELLRGAAATAASDQYAFCVALYEALYGARPFEAETLTQLTDTVETRALPATPPRVDVPAWLHAAVCRGLAKAPERRFAGMAELVSLLARDPEAERRAVRRRALQIAGAIAGTAAIVALLVLAYAAVRRFTAERQAEGRLAAWREQAAALRGRGEADEAARLLQTFVALPENRGMPVVARAYLEWAAAQADDAAAVDAYASAYVAARTPEHGQAALLGLIDRLRARGQVHEAAAALSVLEREAPEAAQGPALQAVRWAAALARRDLPAAAAALAGGDADGWAPVLRDMSRVTAAPAGVFAVHAPWPEVTAVFDLDGDGAVELVRTDAEAGVVRVFAADLGFAPRRTISVGPASRLRAVPALVPGEPLVIGAHATADPRVYELRVTTAAADGTTRRIDAWADSGAFSPVTADVDGDGRRELYVGTEAYARKLWRLDRAADGAWSRGSAHRPTEAAASDVMGVVAGDLDGDGVEELVATVGPWKAYDVRVFKKGAGRELDQVARRSLGSFRAAMTTLRAGGRELVALVKSDAQIAPDRFPPDRPLGAPEGLYVLGLADGAIAEVGYLPDPAPPGEPRSIAALRAGDLDGDGRDELVIDAAARGTMLLRVRPGEPLRPLTIAGLRPLLVHDLDGDGDAEIVAYDAEAPDRVMILGAGAATLPPLPARDVEPRPVPPGIADPAIAEAWRHAEQLVAIGLPGRTAGELAAIARLAGPVAPDMLLRTGELYAAVGADALAAEHYAAAAARDDLAAAALAGAAAARRRLGEFAAAAELTRRRLAVTPADARVAVEAELAALAEATAPREALTLTFTRPLDPRWRVADPVAVQRGLVARALSLWAAPGSLAELPLVWDGGPAALEVELDVDVLEWGTGFSFEVLGAEGRPWLAAGIGAHGLSDRPTRLIDVADDPGAGTYQYGFTGDAVRLRIAVVPGFDTAIREVERDGEAARAVAPMRRRAVESAVPQPGPLRLRIRGTALQAGFVGHAHVRAIRLSGFTLGEPAADPVDAAARRLVEGEYADAAAALAGEVGTIRQVWRIDALLRLGDVAAATAEIRALLAATGGVGPAYDALLQRVRRDDEAARLAGRAAFGPRWIDALILAGGKLGLRPTDVPEVLAGLAAPDPAAPTPADPQALQRLILTHVARGAALRHVGRAEAAQAAYAAAYAVVRADGPELPMREAFVGQLERVQLDLAAERGDVAAVHAWVRTIVTGNATPYLALERLQSDPAIARIVAPDVWAALTAEIQATRERPRRP